MSDYRTIEVSRADAVGRLAFDRPDAHNALNERMSEELVDAVHDLVSDDAVRAIAVTGNGPVFNTGADLTMLSGDGSDEPRLRSLAGNLHEFVGQLVLAPKPVVTGPEMSSNASASSRWTVVDRRNVSTERPP